MEDEGLIAEGQAPRPHRSSLIIHPLSFIVHHSSYIFFANNSATLFSSATSLSLNS